MVKANRSTLTMSLPEYGRSRFGLSKNASYEAGRSGQIPTVRIGDRLFVPVLKADVLFGLVGADDAPSTKAASLSVAA